ncbi:hypothetical protein PV326_006757 [Microctonus aethiopoides]|nr:hypothetical protein PV326_006757 [Microctonus aethiopoides]
MEWYSGSINDAVKTSKVNKAIFVVFVAGKDEVSMEVAKVIDTPEISACLKTQDFVAIKLESGTEDYNFFAQIYQLVPVPSLFFIGLNGQPLEVVAGSVTVLNLKGKIDAVLTKVGKGKSNSSTSFINAEQSAASFSNVPQSSASSNDVVSTQSTSKTAENPSADIKPSSDDVKSEQAESVTSNADNNNQSNQQSSSDKVERARALIELQKKQQMELEREAEKRRELDRRDIGKHMQNARRRQQEMELAMAHEERMKEKALEREARERVIKQIAQDKLERKHREQALLQQANKSQSNQEQPQHAASAFVGDGVARIQFRLPSGNPHMGKFEANTTLRELRAYVSSNIDLPFRQFSMSMSFPRRDLTTEDDERTLLDLELVPTAVILILPSKNSGASTVAAAHGDSFWSRFMWALFAPIFTVYNYLAGYFTGGPRDSTNNQSNDSSASGGSQRSGAFGGNNAGPSSGYATRNMGESSRGVRSRGNVHRLHSGADDNDENNTWNGNSTQQM